MLLDLPVRCQLSDGSGNGRDRPVVDTAGRLCVSYLLASPRPVLPPMFISFEGLDGSGKTTQIERLHARLEADGQTVVRVREPGGTAVSERIRTLLLDPDAPIVPRAELLLFSAARAQVCDEVIRPALHRGDVVLADRFFDSTTAYQGGGRGLADTAWLGGFHRFVTDGLVPDLTVYLRLDPETALARRRARSSADDRMEASGDRFFRKVATAYDALAADEPGRMLVLDAAQPVGALADAIWEAVRRLDGNLLAPRR